MTFSVYGTLQTAKVRVKSISLTQKGFEYRNADLIGLVPECSYLSEIHFKCFGCVVESMQSHIINCMILSSDFSVHISSTVCLKCIVHKVK